MRQTGIFGIDIPQLSDKPDITVVSDAIDAVEKNSGGRIEHLKASFEGNNITLSSTVRDKQYTKYYEGLTVMFESPMTLNMSGTYTVSIYNLSQQPLKLKTRVVKGDVVMATWTEQDGFKVANIAGGGGSTSKISVTQNAHGFNFTAVTYDSQLAKYVPTDISKGVQCEGIAVNIDENTFDLYMEGFVDVDADVRDDQGEGFVSDEYYFASETVAGKMQKEKPTTIVQPLVYAIRLENSLKFYINVAQPHDITHTLLTQENMNSYGFASSADIENINMKDNKQQDWIVGFQNSIIKPDYQNEDIMTYIQDPGTKLLGKVYWDKSVIPPRPYWCANTNTDVSVTNNFRLISLDEIGNSIYRSTTYYSVVNNVTYTIRRAGPIIVYNAIGQLKGTFNGVTTLTTISDARFIPAATVLIHSIISGGLMLDGSVDNKGNITLRFDKPTTDPFVSIIGTGIKYVY